MTYNIYVMSWDVVEGVPTPSIFPCDFDLTERLAKRLCKQYNTAWSGDKLYKGISIFPLDIIVGYVYYETHKDNINEKLFKKLMRQQFSV